MMKKVFALLLAAVMLLSLAACDTGKPNTPPETDPVEDNALSFTFTKFGKAKITILGAEMKKDEYDEDFMRIYYEYLNQDETAAGHTPFWTVNVEVTQDGEELDTDEFSSYDEEHVSEDLFGNYAVQPGVPVRNTMIIYCDPEGGPVEVACYVMVGSWAYNEEDVEWFKFQMDPKDLMPAPTEPFVIAPISEPTYAKSLPTSGTSTSYGNPFTLSLNGYELTTYDGEPALRVKMTYTHQHEWEMSPYNALPINVYQDGIALEQASTWYLDEVTPEDEAFEEDVATGETVNCNAIFLLRGESPAEIVVEQPLDDLRLGLTAYVNGQ